MILLSVALAAFAIASLYAGAQAAREVQTAHRSVTAGFTLGALTASLAALGLFTAPAYARSAGYPGASVALVGLTLPLAALGLSLRIWVLARLCGARELGELIARHYGRTTMIVVGLIALGAALAGLTQIIILAGHIGISVTDGAVDPRKGYYLVVLLLIFTAVPGGIAAAARLAKMHAWIVALGALLIAVVTMMQLHGLSGVIEALGKVSIGIATTGERGGGDYPIGLAVAGTWGAEAGWTSLDTLALHLEWLGSLLAMIWLPWLIAADDPRPLARPKSGVLILIGSALAMLTTFVIGLAGLALEPGSASMSGLLRSIVGATPSAAALIALVTVAALHALALGLTGGAVSFLSPAWARRGGATDGSRQALMTARVASLIVILVAFFATLLQPAGLTETIAGAWRAAALLPLPLMMLCLFPSVGGTPVLAALIVGVGIAAWLDVLSAAGAAIAVIMLLNAFGLRDKRRQQRLAWSREASEILSSRGAARRYGPFAAALTFTWLFFAVGPGIVIGNDVFGAPEPGQTNWDFTLPSLGVWEIGAWCAGAALFIYLAMTLGAGRLTREDWERLSNSNPAKID